MLQWHEVERWATDRLSDERNKNDGELSEVQTATLRGRIALLKELIALPDTKRVMDAQSKSVLPR